MPMIEQLALFRNPSPPAEVAAPLPPSPPEPSPPALTARTPLTRAVELWLEALAADGKSLHTVKAFGSDLRLLMEEAQLTATPLAQISTARLNHWLAHQRAVKDISPKSYARRVTSLKSFFRWLTEAEVLATDPAAPVIQHSVLSPLPDYLNAPQLAQARAAARVLATNGRYAPLVLFELLSQTGIKKGECLELAPGDVDLADPARPFVWVRPPASPNYTARYKERKVPLTPAWADDYAHYAEERATLLRRKGEAFDRRAALFPWSPRKLEYLLEEIGQTAGIAVRLSFDVCRWTCAVRDARAGMDDNAIRQKLGLSKIQWREIGMKLKKLVENPA
jgi:integrase/recombinase XerD